MEHSKNSDSPRRPAEPGDTPTPKKPRAAHGSRNGPKGKPPVPIHSPALPAFEPVPRKFRHDGWTPERQRAFIGKLADTGCVSRAARAVNMSPEGAYWLRRQPGSKSFRRAWEAALDLGVQRLKDELYERALEGQLVPVFIGGKLKGFKRVKNDRLLMFALRMNAKDEYGRRMAATYFDPAAERLHGGSGVSDGGERASSSSGTQWAEGQPVGQQGLAPFPLAGGAGGGTAANTTPAKITDTITGPAVSRACRDDRNAAIVAGFDPAAMSLPEIEAMQAMLLDAATRKRAEEEGPPDQMTGVAFIQNSDDGEFKPLGPLEDIEPVVTEEDREDEFDADEDRWWDLDDDPNDRDGSR